MVNKGQLSIYLSSFGSAAMDITYSNNKKKKTFRIAFKPHLDKSKHRSYFINTRIKASLDKSLNGSVNASKSAVELAVDAE